MNDNKGQTIFLSVIGIATLLVAIVGATFAWFSATVTGNESASSIVVTTATIASVTFEDTDLISNLTALPGWSDTKNFSITHDGGNTVDQEIGLYLTWSHAASAADGRTVATDLYYTLTRQLGANAEETIPAVEINTAQTDKEDLIDSITVAAGSPAQTWNYVMTVIFPETASDQNAQQGAAFAGRLQVKLNGGTATTYYTNAASTGTTTVPEAALVKPTPEP